MQPEDRETMWRKQYGSETQHHREKARYLDKIRQSSNITGIENTIKTAVDNIQQKMQDTSTMWEKNQEFKQIQHMQREQYLRRFLKNNMIEGGENEVSKYRNAIEQLQEYITDVKSGDITKNEQFIVIHYSRLKNELIEKGHQRKQALFLKFVNESKTDLYTFLQELQDIVAQLKTPCSNHDQLKKNRSDERVVRDRMAIMQARIEPIKAKFAFIMDPDETKLDMNNELLTEQDKAALGSIDKAWSDFRQGMLDAKAIIQKTFQEFKQTMEEDIDEFKRTVEENFNNFDKDAPKYVNAEFEANGNKKAFEMIDHFTNECNNLRKQEEDMQTGLDIFEIVPDNYDNLKKVEQMNSSLAKIWSIKNTWDMKWEDKKDINFYELDLEDMEQAATDVLVALRDFPKHDRKLKVTEYIQEQVNTFISTSPLMTDLRDESMRERHWKDLRTEVGEDFDEDSPDFTLEKIFSLNLIEHTDAISRITSDAKKELKIENGLKEIERMWTKDTTTYLDIEEILTKGSGDRCYRIASTDLIIQTYEDHSTQLAGFKATRFYKQFDHDIDRWENALGSITETLELLGIVQDKWQYLESIFGGPADYARQMPKEDAVFKKVDVVFREQMERLHQTKNALAALVEDVSDFVDTLQELDGQLEYIQMSLH